MKKRVFCIPGVVLCVAGGIRVKVCVIYCSFWNCNLDQLGMCDVEVNCHETYYEESHIHNQTQWLAIILISEL